MTVGTQFALLPPGLSKQNPVTVAVNSGKSYSCAVGSVLLNVTAAHAWELEGNGWMIVANVGSGATAQRPSVPTAGDKYLDTSLGYIVVYDGAAWRNPASGAAV